MIQICVFSWYYVYVNMRHTLARILPILNGNIERRRLVDPLDGTTDTLHCSKEIGYLGWCEVMKAWDFSLGGDKNVAGEDGFDVDYSEA